MLNFMKELNTIYADEKPGIESIAGRSNLNDLPVYKSFEFVENSQELKELSKNQYSELKTNRKKELGVLRNRKGPDSHRCSEYSSNGEECFMSATESEADGRKKVYCKWNPADYDNPDMVAFLDDSSYDLFKDILSDTESICQEDFSIDKYKSDRFNLSSLLNSDSESCDSTKETLERLARIANDLEFMEHDDCINEQPNNFKRFLMEDKEEFNEEDDILINHPIKKIVNSIHLYEKGVKNPCGTEQHGDKRLSMKDEEDFQGRNEILFQLIIGAQREKEEIASSNLSLSSTTSAADCRKSNACIIGDLEASMPDAAEDCQQILEPESTMSSNIESFRTSGEGESIASSTEANRPSWPIKKSEGTTSISIPSRIRKANAQSFAFPILTPELPGSPVRIGTNTRQRLATANGQRQLRKTRRWKSIVCCKFVK